jgi:hypothetical protein
MRLATSKMRAHSDDLSIAHEHTTDDRVDRRLPLGNRRHLNRKLHITFIVHRLHVHAPFKKIDPCKTCGGLDFMTE